MQPQEPVTGPAPQAPGQRGAAQPETEATQGPDEKRPPRRRRLRLWLAVAAGVLGILCAGGIGVAVLLYDEETKIDRASPDQVTSSFLRAYLVDRNDQVADLYTCTDRARLEAITALRNEMINREDTFGTSVTVAWESLVISSSSNGSSSIAVDLVISGSVNGRQVSSRSERWTFGLVDQDGWRVCSASKLS